MEKIPFNIKYRPQIESGEYKVETRDGRPGRIVCWDLNDGDYAIVAVITQGDRDLVETYTNEGVYLLCEENAFDLFCVPPVQDLSKFEMATLKAFDKMFAGEKHLTPRTDHVKEAAAELLAIAKDLTTPSPLPEFVWHRNTWPWGKSVRIIKSDGSAVIDMYFVDDNPGVCQISGLLVEESQRRKGFAKRLVAVCEAYCLEHGIFRIDLDSVLTDWVQEFYMRCGFLPIRERDGFMQMRKLLKQK